MFGKLTLDAIPFNEPIIMGGLTMGTLGGLVLVAALIYFKKLPWLWSEWFTSLDHKKIGIMYIIVSLLMLLRGFADALMMRAQMAFITPGNEGFLPPHHYDQIFTAHGVIMIFFVAMPLVIGLMNIVVPLQIGARDMAFPFLNSLSFWLFIVGVALMNISFGLGEFAQTGWLAYPPLSGLEYSPGVGVDYWIWSLQISGLGTLLTGVNFVVTIFKMRAPGMSLMKMPVFTWTALCSNILILAAFPVLTVTIALLTLDRYLGTHFFTNDLGGNQMMYVNLIWLWGHPEVYILVLPAFGVFSEVVPTFSKKKLFGYSSFVWATAAITVLSFIVWLHHFFTMGAGANVNAFFGIATMIIAIPTGVKIFNWLFTMFRGRIHFSTPIIWTLGFFLTFTLGGMTGVLLSVPGIDFIVHNSLFLVAHFHNVIIGGVVFGCLAGLTYWFPKAFGFTLNEKIGRVAAFMWVGGFFIAFVPIYMLGFMGATRRLGSYDNPTWKILFAIALIGTCIIGLAVVVQLLQIAFSVKNRAQLRDTTGDPWGGRTLEWATSSPPPFYNFAHIPVVSERDAFWEMKQNGNINQPPPPYLPIHMPKNTGAALYICAFALAFGFAMIWHIWWLAIVGVLGMFASTILRSFATETDYYVSVETITAIEQQHHKTSSSKA